MDKQWKKKLYEYGFAIITGVIILCLVLFCIFKPDNLMHSDTTAEVILSKLLADENKLVTTSWFYSTEIRIVYSQLLMVPLFKIFDSYRLVKFLSVFIFYILMLWAYFFVCKCRNKHNERAFGQVEVGNQTVNRLELIAGINKNLGVITFCGQESVFIRRTFKCSA